MKYSIIKRKTPAIIGLIYLVLALVYFILTENLKAHIVPGSFNLQKFLLNLNIILLPAWILFLCSLDLSKKNLWRRK